MEVYSEKCDILRTQVREYAKEPVLIAFSGGVDSSLLLKLACEAAGETGQKVYAVTVHSRLHPAEDLDIAARVAGEAGAVHRVLFTDELKEAGIAQNPKDRCYRCKKCLFQKIQHLAGELGVKMILEGTNADDLKVYRPGIRAVRELGILSPLADCGMTKEEIRQYAGKLKISVAGRPAGPCLATRFPYGTQLTYEQMERVDKGERYLRTLGFDTVRLRVHADLVRIEVEESALCRVFQHRIEITEYLKSLGYTYVTIDIEGFRSGSMDIESREDRS